MVDELVPQRKTCVVVEKLLDKCQRSLYDMLPERTPVSDLISYRYFSSRLFSEHDGILLAPSVRLLITIHAWSALVTSQIYLQLPSDNRSPMKDRRSCSHLQIVLPQSTFVAGCVSSRSISFVGICWPKKHHFDYYYDKEERRFTNKKPENYWYQK